MILIKVLIYRYIWLFILCLARELWPFSPSGPQSEKFADPCSNASSSEDEFDESPMVACDLDESDEEEDLLPLPP